jgi:hypothetical protein
MPHTTPTKVSGRVIEAPFASLLQLNRSRAQVGVTRSDRSRLAYGGQSWQVTPDDPGAQDSDIAALLADVAAGRASQWLVVTNDDGSLRHVIPVSEIK